MASGKAQQSRSASKPASPAPPARTTRAKAAAAAAATRAGTPTTGTPSMPARQPLLNRANSIDPNSAPPAPPKKPTAFPKPFKPIPKVATLSPSDADREPIMAYLRIRPHLGTDDPRSTPYLEPLSPISVRMTDPNHPSNPRSHLRPSSTTSTTSSLSTTPFSLYTFSHIFAPSTHQSEFFTKTTLPLVRDILNGQNALLFTYGVTNSGKTYTVQGGTAEGSAGILPRTLDVIFNSIEGLHSDGRYRPVRLHGVELADSSDTKHPPINLDVPSSEPALAQVLAEHLSTTSPADTDIDPTVLKLDRNYEYSIWLSYAEVYNERAYDLLESVNNIEHEEEEMKQPTTKSGLPRPAPYNPHPHPQTQTHPLLLTRKALPVKPSPASDTGTQTSSGKYIAGLRQFRVHSAAQAKRLLKLGQLHRRVFGTLANSQSSRSHGIVTIKVVRGHRGERNDPTALQISRLSLVDLAGSERTKYTHTTGDRLREAGSINKSLMVLGQCMEVMRANQRRLAQSLANAPRTDTRDVKRGLAVVPFRHSKLTEVLMDYFVGDGKAVMIVNVNPYDTGFDENSHVMKFAALAREVYTTPALAPVQRVPQGLIKAGGGSKLVPPVAEKPGEFAPVRRKVTISSAGPGRKYSEAHLEVLEEDEEIGDADEDDDDEPINPLVDALFDEVENLRMKLFESEMRCAIIEAETREEVMKEMEERMRSVEKMYARRLMNEVERSEMKNDAKIDMLHQSGLFGKAPAKSRARPSDISEDMEEEEVTQSMTTQDDDEHESMEVEELVSESDGDFDTSTEASASPSPSPLAAKSKGKNAQKYREIRQYVPDGPECLPLPSEASDDGIIDSDDESTEAISLTTEHTEDGSEEEEEDDDEEEEWVPPVIPTSKARASKATNSRFSSVSSAAVERAAVAPKTPKTRAPKGKVAKLQKEMQHLSLGGESDSDLSAYMPPSRKARRVLTSPVVDEEEESTSEDELATLKKKKTKQSGKKPATIEDVEQTPMRSQSNQNGKRKQTRGSSRQ
ncbi:hypothetical protein PILCRDRAFT_817501 [Piloderma croceum F 1598]|uniref:Kinesin motor domain-containing protein n=1 Tax=Piloderma croceum (strain F 1598) TaxID=765440 RepID=A0A0C3FMU6_PILCF|nr:hypothetical protein PILCRDRAFT_817501 [Piloderma croceum F 1598]